MKESGNRVGDSLTLPLDNREMTPLKGQMSLYYTFATSNFWNLLRKRVEASCSGKGWLPDCLHTSTPSCLSPWVVGQHSPSPLPCPLPSTRASSRRLHNSEGKTFLQNYTESKPISQGFSTGFQSQHARPCENNCFWQLVIPVWELLNEKWEFNHLEAGSVSKTIILFYLLFLF